MFQIAIRSVAAGSCFCRASPGSGSAHPPEI